MSVMVLQKEDGAKEPRMNIRNYVRLESGG